MNRRADKYDLSPSIKPCHSVTVAGANGAKRTRHRARQMNNHFATNKAALREEMNMAYDDYVSEGGVVTVCRTGFAMGSEMKGNVIAAIRAGR